MLKSLITIHDGDEKEELDAKNMVNLFMKRKHSITDMYQDLRK